jgi:hypothetical protein
VSVAHGLVGPAIPGLAPESYAQHMLHGQDRDWPQTNCYTDLWIEMLHAMGHEPRAGLAFTLAQDFEGDQFTFFKFPLEDLSLLYGVETTELAIYDSVEAHCAAQIARGRPVLVEVDGFFLPDTRGVSYQLEHTKTTIGVNALDPAARQIDYFHNEGYFTLSGEDYDAVFGKANGPHTLFPYVEFVKLGGPVSDDMRAAARALLARHFARRPRANPIAAFGARFAEHAQAVGAREPAFFHKYAFNTLRQLGANFELCAAHLDWLDAAAFADAATEARALSSGAKVLQFQLARATARKKYEALEPAVAPLAAAWDRLMDSLAARLG